MPIKVLEALAWTTLGIIISQSNKCEDGESCSWLILLQNKVIDSLGVFQLSFFPPNALTSSRGWLLASDVALYCNKIIAPAPCITFSRKLDSKQGKDSPCASFFLKEKNNSQDSPTKPLLLSHWTDRTVDVSLTKKGLQHHTSSAVSVT